MYVYQCVCFTVGSSLFLWFWSERIVLAHTEGGYTFEGQVQVFCSNFGTIYYYTIVVDVGFDGKVYLSFGLFYLSRCNLLVSIEFAIKKWS